MNPSPVPEPTITEAEIQQLRAENPNLTFVRLHAENGDFFAQLLGIVNGNAEFRMFGRIVP